MNEPVLRRAAPGDSEFAYRVRQAAHRPYVERSGGWDEGRERKLHERRFAEQEFRVIALNGIDVGIVALATDADCLRVNQLLVLPEYQGRGVGRRCMLLIQDEARRLGVPVRLRVLKVNPRALAFYVRLGFRPDGQSATHHLTEWRPQADEPPPIARAGHGETKLGNCDNRQ